MIDLDQDKLTDLVGMAEDVGQVGYWRLSADTDRFQWSPRIYRIYGYRLYPNEIDRVEALSAFHADERDLLNECLRSAIDRREDFHLDARIIRPDGSIRYVKVAGKPFPGNNGPVTEVLGILVDITDYKRTENKLRRLAETDALTGAVNVRRFESVAQAELRRAARFGGEAALAILDIDGFKGINDTFGHLVGDEVLRVFVKMIMQNLREVDIVARIGGDEFAILMPETKVSDAVVPIERIASSVRSLSIDRENVTICLTFSSGVTQMTPDSELRDVLRAADTLLYRAKKAGPNRVEIFNAEERRKRASS
ncbi:MAG: diguanylate cyclase [Alphaproteobacteria bacterium]